MIGIAITDRLTTELAATIGNRCYPDAYRPTSTALYPLVVYQITGLTPTTTHDGGDGLTSANVTIACLNTTYRGSNELGAAVLAALDSQSGTWGGITVQGAFLDDDGVDDNTITDSNGKAIAYGQELRFTIWYER